MVLRFLKGLKIKLQFTGWLQYIPTAILAFLLLILGVSFKYYNRFYISTILLIIGSLFLMILLFDLITVKLKIHPPESLPKKNKENINLFDLMRQRRSCRSFQNRKLVSEDLAILMGYVQSINESARSSLLSKAKVRFEYINAPLTVWPVVGAQEFLVAIAPSEYNRLAVIDVGRYLQKIVMYATRIGISTCWIGPGADQTSIITHLGGIYNSDEDHLICVCAVGYKSRYIPLFVRIINQIFRRRLPINSLFFTDSQLKIPLEPTLPPFDRFERSFEICQWAPSSFNSQTTRCVAIIDSNSESQEKLKDNVPHVVRFDFYQTTESCYYAPVALGIWCANFELGCETLGIEGDFIILSETVKNINQIPCYAVSWQPQR